MKNIVEWFTPTPSDAAASEAFQIIGRFLTDETARSAYAPEFEINLRPDASSLLDYETEHKNFNVHAQALYMTAVKEVLIPALKENFSALEDVHVKNVPNNLLIQEIHVWIGGNHYTAPHNLVESRLTIGGTN